MKRTKAIGELKKLFAEKDLSKCEDIKEENLMGYMDRANVLMVIPLTNIGLEILTSNFDLGEPKKILALSYTETKESFSYENKCKYSIDYLSIILEFIKCFGDDEQGVIFKMKRDFPLTVELRHFRILLAPRVESD